MMRIGDRVTHVVGGIHGGQGKISGFPSVGWVQVEWDADHSLRGDYPKWWFQLDGQGGYIVVIP